MRQEVEKESLSPSTSINGGLRL